MQYESERIEYKAFEVYSSIQLALSGIKFDLSVFPLKKDTYSLVSCALYIRVFYCFPFRRSNRTVVVLVAICTRSFFKILRGR